MKTFKTPYGRKTIDPKKISDISEADDPLDYWDILDSGYEDCLWEVTMVSRNSFFTSEAELLKNGVVKKGQLKLSDYLRMKVKEKKKERREQREFEKNPDKFRFDARKKPDLRKLFLFLLGIMFFLIHVMV